MIYRQECVSSSFWFSFCGELRFKHETLTIVVGSSCKAKILPLVDPRSVMAASLSRSQNTMKRLRSVSESWSN